MSLLKGQQVRELRDLVCEAFNTDELIRLMSDRLDQKLEAIVAVKGLPEETIVFNLIEWLEARDCTGEFMQAVRVERPQVEKIRRFCDPLLVAPGAGGPAPPGGLPDPQQVRKNIIEFGIVFKERSLWFRYLNAYKALHDVLHKLQEMQDGIGQAVERFGRPPNNPIELQKIADALQDDLLADATAANQNTEPPSEADEWLVTFQQEVMKLRAALRPPAPETLGRAVEALRALPNRQAGLNRELVRCVRRLRADELVERMDGILTGLGQIPDSSELQAIMTQFHVHCQQLAGLAVEHDVCQEVETALGSVVRPGKATRDQVFQWPGVLASLLRIAARRPTDARAARVAEYARQFDAAGDPNPAADAFELLREQFGRLFTKTDEDLLKVTDRLVQEAALLDARLRRFI